MAVRIVFLIIGATIAINLVLSAVGLITGVNLYKKYAYCDIYIALCLDNNENIENSLPNVTTGASIKATGKLIPSPASGQAVEVALETLEVLGVSPSDYPLQKKSVFGK